MAKGQSVKFYDTMAAALNPIQRRYEEDPRRSMAASLRKSSMGGPPITSHMQGLASLAETGLGAYMENQALEEKEAASATASQQIVDALAAGQPQIMPAWYEEMKAKGEDDDLLSAPAFVAENPNLYSEKDPYNPGGMPAVISSLEGTGNPDQNSLIAQLRMGQITQQQAAREDATLRAQEIEARDEQRAYDLKYPASPTPSVNEKDYAAAKVGGFKGTFYEFVQAKAMAGQGIMYTPPSEQQNVSQPKATLTAMPGGRADIQSQGVNARNESNRLAQERLELQQKTTSPEYILKKKQAERTAALNIKRKEELPGKQSQIVSMINSKPMFDAAISSAIALGNSDYTGGKTGMLLGMDPSSEQSRLERQLLAIKGIVGLDELISRKESGGTFGALSDTEMQLLQAAKGVFTGEMEGPELEEALKEVKRLHDLDIVEKQRMFTSIYPDAARPWETGKGGVPSGVPPEVWAEMTPEEKALFPSQ